MFSKYQIICWLVGVSLALSVLWYQSNKIDALRESLTTCQVERKNEKALYEEEQNKAKIAIDTQNDKIREYELDTVSYKEKISRKEKLLIEARIVEQEEVNKALSKDSSIENQFRVVTKILKDFANEGN